MEVVNKVKIIQQWLGWCHLINLKKPLLLLNNISFWQNSGPPASSQITPWMWGHVGMLGGRCAIQRDLDSLQNWGPHGIQQRHMQSLALGQSNCVQKARLGAEWVGSSSAEQTGTDLVEWARLRTPRWCRGWSMWPVRRGGGNQGCTAWWRDGSGEISMLSTLLSWVDAEKMQPDSFMLWRQEARSRTWAGTHEFLVRYLEEFFSP